MGPTSNITSVEQRTEIWKGNPIHENYVKNLLLPGIEMGVSNKWLANGVLFYETEAFLTLIKDASLSTKNCKQSILHNSSIPNCSCRLCNYEREATQHIICARRMLSSTASLFARYSIKTLRWGIINYHPLLYNKYTSLAKMG